MTAMLDVRRALTPRFPRCVRSSACSSRSCRSTCSRYFLRTGRVTGLLLLVSESLVRRAHRRCGVRADQVDRSMAAACDDHRVARRASAPSAGSAPALAPDCAHRDRLGDRPVRRDLGQAHARPELRPRAGQSRRRRSTDRIRLCGIRFTGYLLTHVAFLVANPRPLERGDRAGCRPRSSSRALIEERVLAADAAYEAYCQRVGWHLVPGVF